MLLEPGQAPFAAEMALQIDVADVLVAVLAVAFEPERGLKLHRCIHGGVQIGANADAVGQLQRPAHLAVTLDEEQPGIVAIPAVAQLHELFHAGILEAGYSL